MSARAESVVGGAIRKIIQTGGEAARLTRDADDPLCAALADIADERAYQDARWGREHDDGHDAGDWTNIIEDEFWDAIYADSLAGRRAGLVKVAAVCAAAIERIDTGRLT